MDYNLNVRKDDLQKIKLKIVATDMFVAFYAPKHL